MKLFSLSQAVGSVRPRPCAPSCLCIDFVAQGLLKVHKKATTCITFVAAFYL